MADFEIGQNDTLPIIEGTLLADGIPLPGLDLPGVVVKFHLKKGNTIVVNAPAIIIDALAGIVRYVWQVGDTAVIGNYKAEWEITFSPGQILTIPRKPAEKISVSIYGELA